MNRLIVGWHRGGLGYVRELLAGVGADVGMTFDRSTAEDNLSEKLEKSRRIEISPYIVPFLDRIYLENVEVVFVTRDPMRVLNSLYHYGVFRDDRPNKLRSFVFGARPDIEKHCKGLPAQAICRYLSEWEKVIASHASKTIAVENGPYNLLHKIYDRSIDPGPLRTDINASSCGQTLRPSDLPAGSRREIGRLLRDYRYRDDVWNPRGGHAHYINPDWHC